MTPYRLLGVVCILFILTGCPNAPEVNRQTAPPKPSSPAGDPDLPPAKTKVTTPTSASGSSQEESLPPRMSLMTQLEGAPPTSADGTSPVGKFIMVNETDYSMHVLNASITLTSGATGPRSNGPVGRIWLQTSVDGSASSHVVVWGAGTYTIALQPPNSIVAPNSRKELLVYALLPNASKGTIAAPVTIASLVYAPMKDGQGTIIYDTYRVASRRWEIE